jgi:hypothetical protein
MSDGTDGTPDMPTDMETSAGGEAAASGGVEGDGTRPNLTTAVRRRRTDREFFLRLRDAIQQNHKALERLGT